MERRIIRFGLVGAGFIGRIHGLALQAVNRVFGDAGPQAEATILIDADGDLAGLVSHRDLLRSALIEQTDTDTLVERLTLEQIKVREVMTDHVVNSAPDDDLRDAATLMVENKFGCLPVTEGEQLGGILTEADFVRVMAHGD
jgi:CBS domain-containing protein